MAQLIFDPAQSPASFAEIVSDDFPILHALGFWCFCSPHCNDKMIGIFRTSVRNFPRTFVKGGRVPMKTKAKSGAYITRSAACAAFLSFTIVALTSAFNLSSRLPKSVMPVSASAKAPTDLKQPRTLTFAKRVAYQRAIEDV